MNDTERDLRELFEAKAREAGAAPRVTPEVLRRGRRRQAGTVAVAGITALAVAAAAIVSLQVLNRADTDSVPGGPQGNPSFTATIQDFTLTVPRGWTLIDQWPIGAGMAVGSSGGSSSSCFAQAVPPGTGKNPQPDASVPDCTDQQKPTSEPPTIPAGGLPMLTLANDDPGLDGSVCNAGGTLPSGSAALYIGLDYATASTSGWQSTVQTWPGHTLQPDILQNVLEGDLPPEQMPCGPGGYAWFQTGGAPYVAWAGFGSEVTESDRQALLDAFDGMQVRDAEIGAPASRLPTYVLAGGTAGDGPWTIDVGPTDTNIKLTYQEFPMRPLAGGPLNVSGMGDFDVPRNPIEADRARSITFGAVTFDAERVELRPAEGSAPVQGSILHLPETLGAPFDAFVIASSRSGEVVAIGPNGDLGSASVDGGASERSTEPTGPTPEIDAAWARLRNARDELAQYGANQPFDELRIIATIDSNIDYLVYGDPPLGRPRVGDVTLRVDSDRRLVVVTRAKTGEVYCIGVEMGEDGGATYRYGSLNAMTYEDCTGGWS